jgi:hypothetical protein
MASQSLRHMIEGELLGIHGESGCFTAEFPTFQATIYGGFWDLIARWQWTGSERKNVYFLIRISHIKSVNQPDQNGVIRPKATVNEYVEAVGIAFRIVDCREGAIDRSRSSRKADVDKRIIVVSMIGVSQVGGFEYPSAMLAHLDGGNR